MKTLISASQLRRIAMLVALSMMVMVLSGCVNFNHPDLQPLPPDKTKKRVETWKHYMFGWPEDNPEPIVQKPLVIVKEIPAGYPGEGTIFRTTTVTPVFGKKSEVDVRCAYPNGYVSVGEKLDPEWRKKRPKKTSEQSVDYFNFSGQPGSSGHTSGSVIRTF